jgi:putative ABC transport system substrate-binding protein
VGSSGRSLVAIALAVLALLVGLCSSPAAAGPARAPYRVGVLNDARAANHPTVDGLKTGLRDLGLEEGRDVVFDVELTDGSLGRISAAAGALVGAGVDLIFTSGEAATLAAKAATQTVPIVFTLVGDPVASGIVRSLATPAGNLTGVSSLTTELVPKRVEALKALAPRLRRVWTIHLGGDAGFAAALARAGEIAARLGIEIVDRTVVTPDELEQIIAHLGSDDALLVPDLATMDISAALLEASIARRIPAMFSSELWVSHGGLISYGADYRGQGVQASRLVAKILRGARPRDLPVEGADHVVLAVNLKTAASFGLTAPRTLLFRADVIRR